MVFLADVWKPLWKDQVHKIILIKREIRLVRLVIVSTKPDAYIGVCKRKKNKITFVSELSRAGQT